MKIHDTLVFQNVGASQTAFCEIPIGRRFHYLGIEYGNTGGTSPTAATTGLQDIRLIVDDNVQREMSAAELDQINKSNGAKYAMRLIDHGTAASKRRVLPIFLASPWAKLARDQEGTAWTTNWMKRFRLEVDTGTGAGVSLSLVVVFDDVVSRDIPYITKWKREDYDCSSSSRDITTLKPDELISQLSLYNPTTGTINRVQVKHFGREAYDLTRNGQAAVCQHLYEMNENAAVLADDLDTGYPFHLVFNGSGLETDAMPGRGIERIRATFSAASTGYMRVVKQLVGMPD